MTDTITIREYEVSDKNDVLNLLRLNTPTFFAHEEEADFIEYLDNKRELYFVLLYELKIVCCGGINFKNNLNTGIISWDIVHPEYQNKSLGSLMLKFRIEKLKSIRTINSIVVRTTQLTYKFYEKHGFKLIEIIKNYWAEGFDLYNMKHDNFES